MSKISEKDKSLLVVMGENYVEELNTYTDRVEVHIYDILDNHIKSVQNLQTSENKILQWELLEGNDTLYPTGSSQQQVPNNR